MPQAGLLAKDLKGFLGVNLKTERLDLADEELAKAINADLNVQVRTIVLRLGRSKQFSTALTENKIRRLSKINSVRYQVAGQTLYRDQTAIFSALSSNLFTTIEPFRPLNDNSLWAFIADDSGMKKDSGTSFFDWGISPSSTKAVAAPGSGSGGLNGDYSIRFTYVRKTADGVLVHESNPSPISNTISLSGHFVITGIEDPTDSQVTHIRVYRTATGGAIHLFDVEIAVGDKEYGYTHTWENTILGAAKVPVSGYSDSGDIDSETGYIRPSDFKPTYQFGIEFSDSSKAGTQPWEDGITTASGKSLGIFPWEYNFFLGLPMSDNLNALGSLAASTSKFTLAGKTYQCCHNWEVDHLEGNTPLRTQALPAASTPQQNIWALLLSQPDISLGSTMDTDNNTPPAASWAVEFQEHMFMCRDTSNPHYLWWSKRFRPESVPVTNFIEIGHPADPLQCAVRLAGMLGVFSRLTKYRVTGNSTSGFIHTEALSRRGTPAFMAVVPTEFGIIFPAKDGVFATNLITLDQQIAGDILPLFEGESVNGMNPINWDFAHKMSGAAYKRRYYMAYPSGSSEEPDVMAVYSQDTRRWYFYDHPIRSLFVEEDEDDLVGGGLDGFVYVLEDGISDAGENIDMEVESKDLDGGAPNVKKLFRYFRVDVDTLGDDITTEFYIDDTLKRSETFSSARNKVLFKLPEESIGYQARFRFVYSGTKRVRIYGAQAVWLPLEAA